ncbi:Uncharacterised protein [Mycobacteroides abscessus subsp. abscessus]|nr:Uncharacterised protein [Mycobacteroides abscessus subsp. abscessus]
MYRSVNVPPRSSPTTSTVYLLLRYASCPSTVWCSNPASVRSLPAAGTADGSTPLTARVRESP